MERRHKGRWGVTGIKTYSRTLWLWSGCKNGLARTAGVALSEAGGDGKVIAGRGRDGLKRPGDDTGVLFAVRCGTCEGGIML